MSFSYSGNPADSTLDECRFILGDTDSANPILQDEEIEYILANAGSNMDKVKYDLFKQAATIFARAIKRTLGPQSEDPTSRLSYFREQAKIYEKKLSYSGVSIPAYQHPKTFYRGMHNNPPFSATDGGA